MTRATEVFTPTTVPTFTYVDRSTKRLEERLRQAFEIPRMVISLSGPSKSGKTVLVNKVVEKGHLIPVSGASVRTFAIDGAMNGSTFLTYVERCLAPTLHRGDIVIIDNLPAHKVAGVTDAIEAVGARAVYLPPYSPDLNPIEQLFSKLKALLRKAAERTIPRLLRKIRSLLRTVSPDECLNFFRHAGYASK
jgi:transposase